VRELEREELDKLRSSLGEDAYEGGRFGEAAELFERIALDDELVEFLTLPAMERLERPTGAETDRPSAHPVSRKGPLAE
jgi:malate synthase